jgi:hypothetical protein
MRTMKKAATIFPCMPLRASPAAPQRFHRPTPTDQAMKDELHAQIATILGALTAGAFSLLASVGSDLTGLSVEEVVEVVEAVSQSGGGVLDNNRLICMVLSGAIGGGLLAVLLFPLPSAKELCLKFLGSGMAAIFTVPGMFRLCQWDLAAEYVLGVAFIVAFLSWALLLMLIPVFLKVLEGMLKKVLGHVLAAVVMRVFGVKIDEDDQKRA